MLFVSLESYATALFTTNPAKTMLTRTLFRFLAVSILKKSERTIVIKNRKIVWKLV